MCPLGGFGVSLLAAEIMCTAAAAGSGPGHAIVDDMALPLWIDECMLVLWRRRRRQGASSDLVDAVAPASAAFFLLVT